MAGWTAALTGTQDPELRKVSEFLAATGNNTHNHLTVTHLKTKLGSKESAEDLLKLYLYDAAASGSPDYQLALALDRSLFRASGAVRNDWHITVGIAARSTMTPTAMYQAVKNQCTSLIDTYSPMYVIRDANSPLNASEPIDRLFLEFLIDGPHLPPQTISVDHYPYYRRRTVGGVDTGITGPMHRYRLNLP